MRLLGAATLALLLAAPAAAAPPPEGRPAARVQPTGGLRMESAALLMSGQQGGEIPLEGRAAARPAGSGGALVPVAVALQAHGPALLEGHEGEVLRVEISIYALAGGAVRGSLAETVELDLARLRPELARRGLLYTGELELPPGDYTVRALLRNPATGRLALRSLPLQVPAPEAEGPSGSLEGWVVAARPGVLPLAPERLPAWAVTAAEEPSSAAPAPAQAEPRGRGNRAARRAARQVSGGYREALGRLAAGDPEGAGAALNALEARALAAGLPPEDVAGAEAGAARRLAARDPEVLVPAVALHLRRARESSGRGDYTRAALARQTAERLIEAYAGAVPGEASRALAARMTLTLGNDFLEAGLRASGRRLLRLALERKPDETAALLQAAVDAERRGETAEATGYLERLLAAEPGHAEARLRLALAEARAGRSGEALRRLAEIAEIAGGATEDWIFAVAAQERARLLLAANRLADARSALETALRRLPGDEKLTLLLAAAHDREGRRGASRELLAGWAPRPGAAAAGARHRYGRLPLEALDAVRREVDARATERLPALAAALGGSKAEAETEEETP